MNFWDPRKQLLRYRDEGYNIVIQLFPLPYAVRRGRRTRWEHFRPQKFRIADADFNEKNPRKPTRLVRVDLRSEERLRTVLASLPRMGIIEFNSLWALRQRARPCPRRSGSSRKSSATEGFHARSCAAAEPSATGRVERTPLFLVSPGRTRRLPCSRVPGCLQQKVGPQIVALC